MASAPETAENKLTAADRRMLTVHCNAVAAVFPLLESLEGAETQWPFSFLSHSCTKPEMAALRPSESVTPANENEWAAGLTKGL